MKVFALALCLTFSLVLAINDPEPLTTCGGNCPSNDCASCPCGTTPDVVDVAAMCQNGPGWSQACCECIAKAESGANRRASVQQSRKATFPCLLTEGVGNAHAANENTNGSFDVGLWQVNSGNWAACNGGSAPCDTTSNKKCAEMVWGWGGKTWRYWSTCIKCGCCHIA